MSEWNGAAAASGESWNDGGSDGWKGEQSADGNANNISMHANGDFEGGGNAADGGCRNCHQDGHFARDCPEPKQMGECFNCGEVGHNKADCPNPRVARPFTGTCRLCGVEGHPAAECPDKGPTICQNCLQEGHKATECEAARAIDTSGVPEMESAAAWNMLKAASDEKDIDDFKAALRIYSKANPGLGYDELESQFRAAEFNIFLIALEKETPLKLTNVNLQGKVDCKYQIAYYFNSKPKRAKFADGWPPTPEENIERLKDTGEPMEKFVPLCNNCNELGHIAKACPQEKVEIASREIECSNCHEIGHRLRDCTQPRPERNLCKNCKQPGHKAADCTEPRSAEGVECKRCNEIGHFAKDCPTGGSRACRNCGEEGHMSKECDKPKNPDNAICRNCDETGHFSRDCPKPRDYSRVKCQNCGEMGHTVKRCTQPAPEADGDGDFGENGDGGFDASADAGNSGGDTSGWATTGAADGAW